MAPTCRAEPESFERAAHDPILGTHLPIEGFVRQPQLLAVLPISAAHLWDGIKKGQFAKGISLSPKVTVWAVEDVRRMIAYYKQQANWTPWEPPKDVALINTNKGVD